MRAGVGMREGFLTRRLVVALAGCVVLAGLNPMLYGTAWWDIVLGGAVAAGLLLSARTLLGRYRRSLDDPGDEPRRINARDVAIFVAGQSLGFVAAIPLAVEIGSALVFAVVGLYVLTRVLLITQVWWLQRRRAHRADSDVFVTRQSALEGARGVFHFGEVFIWAVLLLGAWGSLLMPVPFAAAFFLAGWYSMIASYIYLVRLL